MRSFTCGQCHNDRKALTLLQSCSNLQALRVPLVRSPTCTLAAAGRARPSASSTLTVQAGAVGRGRRGGRWVSSGRGRVAGRGPADVDALAGDVVPAVRQSSVADKVGTGALVALELPLQPLVCRLGVQSAVGLAVRAAVPDPVQVSLPGGRAGGDVVVVTLSLRWGVCINMNKNGADDRYR